MSYKLGSSEFVIGGGDAGIFGAADIPAGTKVATPESMAALAAEYAVQDAAVAALRKCLVWGAAGYAIWYFWMKK